MTYVPNMWNTYVLTTNKQMNVWEKTTTNKWTYERSHKSLNSYSLVEYNKIYPNTNSWKTLQEESLRQIDFDNLYFWNTLNKIHQGIFLWNRNNILHTNNKKHVYKERVKAFCGLRMTIAERPLRNWTVSVRFGLSVLWF